MGEPMDRPQFWYVMVFGDQVCDEVFASGLIEDEAMRIAVKLRRCHEMDARIVKEAADVRRRGDEASTGGLGSG